MMYGGGEYDTVYMLNWLTTGTAQIPQWRFTLAMALAFPGIFYYNALVVQEAALHCTRMGREERKGRTVRHTIIAPYPTKGRSGSRR